MYVKHNIEARSGNHCCRGKSVNITYYDFVFVAILSSVVCPDSGIS